METRVLDKLDFEPMGGRIPKLRIGPCCEDWHLDGVGDIPNLGSWLKRNGDRLGRFRVARTIFPMRGEREIEEVRIESAIQSTSKFCTRMAAEFKWSHYHLTPAKACNYGPFDNEESAGFTVWRQEHRTGDGWDTYYIMLITDVYKGEESA